MYCLIHLFDIFVGIIHGPGTRYIIVIQKSPPEPFTVHRWLRSGHQYVFGLLQCFCLHLASASIAASCIASFSCTT